MYDCTGYLYFSFRMWFHLVWKYQSWYIEPILEQILFSFVMHFLTMSCMILSDLVVVKDVKDANAKLTLTMVATALPFDAFLTLFPSDCWWTCVLWRNLNSGAVDLSCMYLVCGWKYLKMDWSQSDTVERLESQSAKTNHQRKWKICQLKYKIWLQTHPLPTISQVFFFFSLLVHKVL